MLKMYLWCMYRSTVNNQHEYEVVPGKDGQMKVNGQLLSPDMVEIRQGLFHVILNDVSTEAEVVSADYIEKVFHIRVNGNTYKVEVADQYDALLKAMGMDMAQSRKVSDMKAPMPGLVSEVAVVEGQELKKGDKVLVLEAMKMENILKAPEDGVVKKVHVAKGQTVEKNMVLVTFA
ncbi:MAG: biotin/lipoyl-containing protein [Arcticibacter sp.]